jgi:hypothetical protein
VTTGLTSLGLRGVTLATSQAGRHRASGGSQLLQLLARLPALRSLCLQGIDGEWPQQLSLYSALTASSNLQSLEIGGCDIQNAAWAHVFLSGRQLPHLDSILIEPGELTRGAAPGEPVPCRPHLLSSAAFAALCGCCPGLVSLDIKVVGDAALAPLQPLTALTNLALFGFEPAAVASLASLTWLPDLFVLPEADAEDVHAFHLCELMPLTAVTCLTKLSTCVRLPEGEEGGAGGGEARCRSMFLRNTVSGSWLLRSPWASGAGL